MSVGCLGTWLAFVVLPGCKPVRAPGPPKAVLVGLDESRSKGDQRSKLHGKIVAIDGRDARMARGSNEMPLEAGCHIVEAMVNYKVTRPTDDPCPWYPLIGGFGDCDKSAHHSSGRAL